MPIAAGGFLYIAIVDLFPEIIKEKKPGKIILNLMAILAGLSIMISSKIFIK